MPRRQTTPLPTEHLRAPASDAPAPPTPHTQPRHRPSRPQLRRDETEALTSGSPPPPPLSSHFEMPTPAQPPEHDIPPRAKVRIYPYCEHSAGPQPSWHRPERFSGTPATPRAPVHGQILE